MTYLKDAYYEAYDKITENEQNNPFNYIDHEEEIFIEPIKNPFTCEGAYLLACKDVANAIAADKEVGCEYHPLIQMQKWLSKLAYEYI